MNSLSRAGRELGVQLLLDEVRPVVAALTETEVMQHDIIVFKNYRVFYPLLAQTGRFRLLLLIREDWAVKFSPTVLKTTAREVWVGMRAPGGALAVGSIYRQWTDSEEMELTQLCDQMTTITEEYGRVVIMGDFNLDVARVGDPSYYRRRLLGLLMGCLELNELILANLQDLSPTYHSHGTFDDGCGATSRRTSILDHIYFRGLPPPPSTCSPLP